MNAGQQADDELAIELEGHLDFVRRMARALVRDDHVAEDVVQETMMAAIAHRPSPSLGLRVWLSSVLRRRVLLHFRTEQRRVARETLLVREQRGAIAGEAGRAMESIERTSLLGKSVADLSDPYRTVVVLRYLDGLSPLEISRRLDRPVNTVNTQLQRGLERLRQSLDEGHDGDRRAWVVALLPHALDGRQGWWPASVGGVGGLSYGVLAQFALLIAGLGGGAAWVSLAGASKGESRVIALAEAPSPTTPAQDDSAVEQAPEASASQDIARTAASTSPLSTAPENDEAAMVPEDQGLRVVVRSSNGIVRGAAVRAVQRAQGDQVLHPTISRVTGGADVVLTVQSTMSTREKPGADAAPPLEESSETGEDGVAELSILDGQGWNVHVDAAGFATSSFLFDASKAATAERTVVLQPEARLVVDRGSFPLESLIFVQLKCLTNGLLRYEKLLAGVQEIEFEHLPAANWEVEALSDTGDEVGHWYRSVKLDEGLVMRLDLSRSGVEYTRVKVTGGYEAAVPHFVQVHGPQVNGGHFEWSYVVPVVDRVAELHGLPPGPALVKVLSWNAEIARMPVEMKSASARQDVEIQIPDGVIQVRHPGVNSKDLQWRLGMRSDLLDSRSGWAELGGAFQGEGKSLFLGCAPGEYRLWMFGGDVARRFDVEVRGEVVDVLVEQDSMDVASIKVEMGAGLAPGGAVQIELYPGGWLPVEVRSGELKLSHGKHRIRCGLDGLGFVVRDVEVPIDKSVSFAETHPRIEFPVVFPGAKQKTWLNVIRLDPSSPGPAEKQQVLVIEEDGTGAAALRPGRYLFSDREGRSATVDVGDTPKTIELELR